MKIIQFTESQSSQWDEFLKFCPMGTFLHSRKFLSYHENRFKDESVIVCNEDDTWLGIFPAAVDLEDFSQIISHPGITYGGALHQGKLIGSEMLEALSLILQHYKENGYSKLIYKAIPTFYHSIPSCDDVYALFQLKADLFRRDLSCTVDLQSPTILSNKALSKMRNMLRKSENNNVKLDDSNRDLEKLWVLLTKNLMEKYNKKPTHSLEEMNLLIEKFPDNISILTAKIDDVVIAGAVLFKKNITIHTQYLVNTECGKENFALDSIIQSCIKKSKEEGYRFFDFGINTENNGLYLNHSLFFSKAKHGGAGTIHDHYFLQL
ncbi:MAG: GNAT family N-acetyltransferase [Alphaproteobacteria bacterium]|nr:GNAT family N-acetyltransferase [Alphaproteobacteria bacterium]